jgi:hypothetical protein
MIPVKVEKLELSRLPILLVSLAVKSRRSSPCREPRERSLTHGPQVPLLTRAAPLRSDTIIRASSCCAVRRSPLLQCTVLPPHSETSDSSGSDDVDYTPVKFTPPRAKSCAFILTPSIDVARLMKTYLETVRPTDNGDRRDWVQFLSRHVTTQEKSTPTPILVRHTWVAHAWSIPSAILRSYRHRQRVSCTPSCRVPACGCPVQRKVYYAPVSRILK